MRLIRLLTAFTESNNKYAIKILDKCEYITYNKIVRRIIIVMIYDIYVNCEYKIIGEYNHVKNKIDCIYCEVIE